MTLVTSWGLANQKPGVKHLFHRLDAANTAEICQYIKGEIEFGNYTKHRTYSEEGEVAVNLQKRHSYLIYPPMDMPAVPMIEDVVTRYWKENFQVTSGEMLLNIESQLFYYPPGIGILAHVDDHTPGRNGQAKPLATNFQRAVTSILYLNDDYEGGEIEFPNQGLVLKPKPGELVVFPSNKNFPHLVHPITSGERMSFQRVYGILGTNQSFSTDGAPVAGASNDLNNRGCC